MFFLYFVVKYVNGHTPLVPLSERGKGMLLTSSLERNSGCVVIFYLFLLHE